MSSLRPQQSEVERMISAHETETAERLATIRSLEERWDDYRRVVREARGVFEEAGSARGSQSYLGQMAVAARRELDSYVGHIVSDQSELLTEVERRVRSAAEAELERLQQEKAGAL